jgi:hypothetical protein
MSKCDATDRYREVVFEQDIVQFSAWTRDNLRLGQTVKVEGEEGEWFIRALTTNTLCETEMLAKHKDRPKLYPMVRTG